MLGQVAKNKIKTFFVILITVTLLVLGILWHSMNSVKVTSNLDKGSSLSFQSINPSLHHGLYITYNVSGDSEISRIYWRLFPWDEIETEK